MPKVKAKNNQKKKSKPKKHRHTFNIMQTKHSEIWAIVSGLSALFIFIGNQFPDTTGIVGRVLIQEVGPQFIGSSLTFLPFFLLLISITIISASSKKLLYISALLVSFIAFSISTELVINGYTPLITWPPPINGGGTMGYVGLHISIALIGINGTRLLLFGIFSGTLVLILNISLKHLFKVLYLLLFTIPKQDKRTHIHSSPFTKKRFHQLFKKNNDIPTSKKAPNIPKTKDQKILINHSQSRINDDIKNDISNTSATDETTTNEPEIVLPTIKKKTTQPNQTSKNGTSTYTFPPLTLLEKPGQFMKNAIASQQTHQENAHILESTLASFNVEASVVNITPGPSITRYELKPGDGVKISKITNLSNDIALKLAATDVRIEAPIPGKSLIGIEIPNAQNETITLRNIIETTDFYNRSSKLVNGLGVTISGDAILMDLEKMPHVLIAGATGSGKSVCLNTIIISILLRATPEDVKFLMIDPKKVELSLYENIPHLIAPVVTDPNKAAATLKKWALAEMENRYETFSRVGVKNIEGYNAKMNEFIDMEKKDSELAKEACRSFLDPDGDYEGVEIEAKKLPYIVVIIDELADLMMVASQDVESTICRLAQMARATGIHLVIATQRPSVNVITGLIKANVPSRVSFYLQSQIDSRTVLDSGGAEKLLGKGDMLYSPVGSFKPQRLQGVFVSEKEIKNIVNFIKKQAKPMYLDEIIDIEPLTNSKENNVSNSQDELFEEAKNIVMNTQYASTSYLQRKLRIGYNRAARIMDELKEQGIIDQYALEKKPRT